MKVNTRRFLQWFAFLFAVLPITAECTQSSKANAETLFNHGVGRYQAMLYDSAIDDFRSALTVDPAMSKAVVYLGATYAKKYQALDNDPKYKELEDKAVGYYGTVLRQEPENVNAVLGMAGIYQKRNDRENTRVFILRATKLIQNPAVFCALGVADWNILHSDSHLSAADRKRLVDEGLESIERALALRPQYGEAMAFKGLLLREKSSDAPNAAERTKLEAQADEWARRHKEAESTDLQGGVHKPLPITDGVIIFVPVDPPALIAPPRQ